MERMIFVIQISLQYNAQSYIKPKKDDHCK